MLSFYLAFLYAARDYYDPDRILCMAQYLFKVQQQNRLRQKGLLKRFSINCYGHQLTMEEIRAQKSEKYMELRDRRGTREYEEYFLRYRPGDKKSGITESKKKEKRTVKKRVRREKTKKRGRGGLFF